MIKRGIFWVFVFMLVGVIFSKSITAFSCGGIIGQCYFGCGCYSSSVCKGYLFPTGPCVNQGGLPCASGYTCSGGRCALAGGPVCYTTFIAGPYESMCGLEAMGEDEQLWMPLIGEFNEPLSLVTEPVCVYGDFSNCIKISSDEFYAFYNETISGNVWYFAGVWLNKQDVTSGDVSVKVYQNQEGSVVTFTNPGIVSALAGFQGTDYFELQSKGSIIPTGWELWAVHFKTEGAVDSLEIRLSLESGSSGTAYFGSAYVGLSSSCSEQDCNDGFDDDGDGFTDMADYDCLMPVTTPEPSPYPPDFLGSASGLCPNTYFGPYGFSSSHFTEGVQTFATSVPSSDVSASNGADGCCGDDESVMNILENGDFELGSLFGWTVENYAALINYVPPTCHLGDYCAALPSNAGVGGQPPSIKHDDIVVLNGETYSLSAWLWRWSSSTGGVTLSVIPKKEDGTTMAALFSQTINNNNLWTKIETSFTINNPEIESVEIKIEADDNTAGRVDDVELNILSPTASSGNDYGFISPASDWLCYQCPSGSSCPTDPVLGSENWGWLDASQNSFKIITLQ